ncbi:MAG: DUF192 domain-containing protein [Alphaproteobacteria bacterium]|nr:DUF192 domain-containing protein [Alphaproteobacteria bacterium]
MSLTRNIINVAILLTFILIPVFSAHANCECANKNETLFIETSFQKVAFEIEVARSEPELKKGLMFRRTLADNYGMLFVFGRPHRARFWMQNTYLSLDLLFLDMRGRIVEIIQKTTPLSEKILETSVKNVKAVLEVQGGTVDRLNLGVGDRVLHRVFKNA